MKRRTPPALIPCLTFLASVHLAQTHLTTPRVGLAVALAAAALALGRPLGRNLVAAAGGLLITWCAAPAGPPPRPERPLEAVGRVVEHWRSSDDGWVARFALERWRQGLEVGAGGREIWLVIPGLDPPPAPGSRLRARGQLSLPAPRANGGRPSAPGLGRLRVKSRLLLEQETPPGAIGWLAGRLRERLERAFRAAPAEGSGTALARALVLGDTAGLTVPQRQGLARFGGSHVLSVSGLHVSLVAVLVWSLTAFLPRRWQALRRLAVLAAVGLYLFAVGPLPPLLRAAAMALLATAALTLERPPVATNALALAAAGLVALRPAVLGDLGFQLSVSATFGVVAVGPWLAASWAAVGAGPGFGLPKALAGSLGALACSWPWALPVFQWVTPWALLANLVIVPWSALALAVAGAWTALALVAPAGAAWASPALTAAAWPLDALAAVPPSPWLATPWAAGPWTAAAVAGALVWLIYGRRWGPLGACLLPPLLSAALAAWPGRAGARLELVVFDVGQGDAILLRDGADAVLIDGGGWPKGDFAARVLVPELARRGLSRLSATVVTHGDVDHCGGVLDLAGYVPLGPVWLPPGARGQACPQALAARPGVRVRPAVAGQELRVGAWHLRVLHPSAGAGALSDNDGSLVVLATAHGRRVLLPGDLEAAGEAELLRRLPAEALAADVLKVGHHGSDSSTRRAWLTAVAPRLALISAGARNPYGHPSPRVLARLQGVTRGVLRTDRDGQVALSWGADGPWRLDLPGAPK